MVTGTSPSRRSRLSASDREKPRDISATTIRSSRTLWQKNKDHAAPIPSVPKQGQTRSAGSIGCQVWSRSS